MLVGSYTAVLDRRASCIQAFADRSPVPLLQLVEDDDTGSAIAHSDVGDEKLTPGVSNSNAHDVQTTSNTAEVVELHTVVAPCAPTALVTQPRPGRSDSVWVGTLVSWTVHAVTTLLAMLLALSAAVTDIE